MERPPSSFISAQESKEARAILTREAILEAVAQHIERYEIERELSDAEGIYLLEARAAGEKAGEFVEYRYQRKGIFGRNQAAQTTLQVAYYQGGVPIGGKTVADYDEQSKTWVLAKPLEAL
jgi:hypothetical protein